MSRLAKKDIILPAGVEATLKDSSVTLKGPLGTLARTFPYEIKITKEEGGLRLKPTHMNVQTRASWGTVASHIMNMIEGVTKGYQKKLLIEGTGFKWDVAGKTLNLALGFSHPVKMQIPEGLTVKAEKGELTIAGIDKEVLGQFTADVRGQKKPEPYKGKGIRYSDEVIARKQGKKSAT